MRREFLEVPYNRGGLAGPFLIHAGPGIGCIVNASKNEQGQYSQQQKIGKFMNQITLQNGTYGTLTVHRGL